MAERDDRIAEIKARLAKATPGLWEVKSHSHPEAGCRCLSCDIYTGSVLDHPSWLSCDETPEFRAAYDAAARLGKVQEGCFVAPMPYADAEFAAHAVEDVTFLLAEVERLRGQIGKDGMEPPPADRDWLQMDSVRAKAPTRLRTWWASMRGGCR